MKSLKPPMKLTLQALETLAVVAYKQPVTGPEISEIRGVESAGVLGSLISRKLITTAGRKQVIGRPILYKTTKDFLLRFGLKDLNELPSIEEFEKMAGELAESDMGAAADVNGKRRAVPQLREPCTRTIDHPARTDACARPRRATKKTAKRPTKRPKQTQHAARHDIDRRRESRTRREPARAG